MSTAVVFTKVPPKIIIPLKVQAAAWPDSDNDGTSRLTTLTPKVEKERSIEGRLLEECVARQAPGIELRILLDFGRCLFASAGGPTIKAGTSLIAEEPLLQVAPEDVSNPTALFLAFAALSDQTRHVLLDSMCRPDITNPSFREQPHAISALKEAQVAKASNPASLVMWTVNALADFWLCYTFNTHRFYGGAGLFHVGSKLNHACRPNSVHRTWGLLQSKHVAVRDIQVTTHLYLSYMRLWCGLTARTRPTGCTCDCAEGCARGKVAKQL
eukprot:6578000-Pyramimonas_sp.AAC.1